MKTLIIVIVAGCAFFLICTANGSGQRKQPLTLETIFGGGLSSPSPSELYWAPDGRHVAFFLPEGEGGARALWMLEVATGKKVQVLSAAQAEEMAPSSDQASLSERERTRRDRYDIPSYVWAPAGNRVLLTGGDRLYLYDIDERKFVQLVSSRPGLLDPKFSPDGKWVSFVYRHDIWAVPSSGGKEKQLTFGGTDLLLHGEPDWVYQEELDFRSGYRWSPDSRHIAYTELDESVVPAYPLVDELHLNATVDLQRYPKAGDPNPKVRAGVVNVENARTAWCDRSAEFIPRIDWADNRTCVLQLLNRAQSRLEVVEVKPETGGSRVLLEEQDHWWVDVRDDLRFLSGGREFLWTSDRTGFRHIYLYGRAGNLVRQLTKGDWVVRKVEGVDETKGWIYYTSNQASTLGSDLYRVKMDGSNPERVTAEPGSHAVTMNLQATAYVDSFSSLEHAPEVRVRDLASGQESRLSQARSLEEFELAAPEMKLLNTSDGAPVRVLLYKPRNLAPGRKYPVVVYSYGMPGFPAIQDTWQGNRGLFHQFLTDHGFIVALIDDRSSAIPGHKYAVAARGAIGSVAAGDHEFAAQYLKSLSYVNGDALAIWGWSGGGFTATWHMTHTGIFKAGIAGAPVTDWRLYDSIYTERYMGLPTEAPEAYDRASSIAAAADCRGRLLIIYGTQDDNVHPQNTVQLVNALIRNKQQFDLMMYPGKTHGISGAAENLHLYTMIFDFLQKYLK